MYCAHSSHVSWCLVNFDSSVLALNALCTSPSQGSVSDWHTSLHPKSRSDVASLDLDLPSKDLANCFFQMEELTVVCDNKGELLQCACASNAHSVTEAGRTLFTVLCNYSLVHNYTTLPPSAVMVIQVYSGVFKAVLYVDERAYDQFCNDLWHRSVFCGVSHTLCWLLTSLEKLHGSQEIEIR